MKNKHYDDDGRKIADMSDINVTTFGFGYNPRQQRNTKKEPAVREASVDSSANPQPLTKEETRFMMFRAMLSGMAIALVFIALAAIFLLFCIYVWFR